MSFFKENFIVYFIGMITVLVVILLVAKDLPYIGTINNSSSIELKLEQLEILGIANLLRLEELNLKLEQVNMQLNERLNN
jgi:hypothetical protein